MTLYWGINLLSLSDQDIPLTHIRSANRSPDGGFSIGAGETESFHYIDLGAHQGESIAGFIEYLRYYNISEKYSLLHPLKQVDKLKYGALLHTQQ